MGPQPTGTAKIGTAVAGAATSPPTQDAAGDFVGMLQQALGQLNELAQTADAAASQAATGEDVDLHEVMLAMESAGLGFQLALQVRNKLVEAYQEIIRMQV
ncbi:MAG: flagellar hook-basal body complex protein FliE [Chloroflexi bacterium]|nr:flagellar hook-basal body complex protein FliE [Chloroflexota bacterium]